MYACMIAYFYVQNLLFCDLKLTASIALLFTRPTPCCLRAALDNLSGALLIAGHFDIPEVCIFFSHQLFRGNRTTKSSATGLDAFSSSNFPPLAHVGSTVDVRWDLVRTPAETEQALGFRVMTDIEPNVGIFSLFPGITPAFVRNALAPPLQGCVMRSFGTGNVCNDKAIVEALGDATRRGVVIVNCTQCRHGSVQQGTYEVRLA